MKFLQLRIILFLIASTCSANAQRVLCKELLGRSGSVSTTLQMVFADSAELRVLFGTNANNLNQQTAWHIGADSMPLEVVIEPLNPNTQYYYKVQHRIPNGTTIITRPQFTFRTQRPPGENFRFVVQADPHLDVQSDTALYARCLQNQLEDAPDFMIDLGDIIMVDKCKNASNQITRDTIEHRNKFMRSFYEIIGHSVPVMMAMGNHEAEAGWYLNNTPNNLAIWGTLERKKWFINPYPDGFFSGDTSQQPWVGQRESYYAWHWGDALMIVLDPYWHTSPKPDSLTGWRWTLGLHQYQWLKKTLENSTATYKFVFAHQLVGGDPDGRGGIEFAHRYEWGGSNLDGTYGFLSNRPGWYKPIKDLLKEHRVNIFFHGHDHFFGKQDLDCLVYQETPQPSHPNFTNTNYATAYGYLSGQILPQSGHLRVSVQPNGVRVEYVRAYLPQNESPTRHNKDVSASYFIPLQNCYDSLALDIPVLWNKDYSDEIIYPNPFSESTTISFRCEKPELMTMIIYSANGKMVRQLMLNEPVVRGSYQLVWDGHDRLGRPLEVGNYFYRLTGNLGTYKTGKLCLTR